MNQCAILYLLTIVYVSCAPADEDRETVCKLQKATFDILDGDGGSQTFDAGDVYLYKMNDVLSHEAQQYVVADADKFSKKFPIYQCITVAFDQKFIIKMADELITLTVDTLEGDAFAVYKKIFSLDDFSEEFSVTGVKMLENVSTIRAKEVDHQWLFVAMDRDNAPRLIFPTNTFELPQREDSDEVSVVLDTKPGTVFTVQFDDSTKAKKFYDFIDSVVSKSDSFVDDPCEDGTFNYDCFMFDS